MVAGLESEIEREGKGVDGGFVGAVGSVSDGGLAAVDLAGAGQGALQCQHEPHRALRIAHARAQEMTRGIGHGGIPRGVRHGVLAQRIAGAHLPAVLQVARDAEFVFRLDWPGQHLLAGLFLLGGMPNRFLNYFSF